MTLLEKEITGNRPVAPLEESAVAETSAYPPDCSLMRTVYLFDDFMEGNLRPLMEINRGINHQLEPAVVESPSNRQEEAQILVTYGQLSDETPSDNSTGTQIQRLLQMIDEMTILENRRQVWYQAGRLREIANRKKALTDGLHQETSAVTEEIPTPEPTEQGKDKEQVRFDRVKKILNLPDRSLLELRRKTQGSAQEDSPKLPPTAQRRPPPQQIAAEAAKEEIKTLDTRRAVIETEHRQISALLKKLLEARTESERRTRLDQLPIWSTQARKIFRLIGIIILTQAALTDDKTLTQRALNLFYRVHPYESRSDAKKTFLAMLSYAKENRQKSEISISALIGQLAEQPAEENEENKEETCKRHWPKPPFYIINYYEDRGNAKKPKVERRSLLVPAEAVSEVKRAPLVVVLFKSVEKGGKMVEQMTTETKLEEGHIISLTIRLGGKILKVDASPTKETLNYWDFPSFVQTETQIGKTERARMALGSEIPPFITPNDMNHLAHLSSHQ